MVKPGDPINSRQRAVLERLRDGDEITRLDSALVTSVDALKTRRLVELIKDPDVRWRAKLTPQGAALVGGAASTPRTRKTKPAPRKAGEPARTVEELVADLQAANNELVIPDPPSDDRHRWRQVINHAITQGPLPQGTRIRHSGRDSGDLVIRLVEDAPENRPPQSVTPTLPMPEEGAQLHPLLRATKRAFRKGKDGWGTKKADVGHTLSLHVSPDSLDRALQLVQAIVDEGQRRGYSFGPLPKSDSGVGVTIGEHAIALHVEEERDRTPHEPTAKELRDKERWPWTRMPQYDYFPSGRLCISSFDRYRNVTLANDRKRWRCEDRLGVALERIEELAAEREERRLEEIRKLENERRAWESALVRARQRWEDAERLKVLDDQLQRHARAMEVRALATALRSAQPEPITSEAAAWLGWIDSYAERLDPANDVLSLADLGEPEPYALREYLDGWSPHEPHRIGLGRW